MKITKRENNFKTLPSSNFLPGGCSCCCCCCCCCCCITTVGAAIGGGIFFSGLGKNIIANVLYSILGIIIFGGIGFSIGLGYISIFTFTDEYVMLATVTAILLIILGVLGRKMLKKRNLKKTK